MNPRPGPWPALGLAAASAASVVLACLTGPMDIPAADVWKALWPWAAPADPATAVIVAQIRLPRAVLAWLVGASLAVSGAAFQGILQNPLADPFTIGVSTGAAFGASVAIFLGLASAPAWLGMGVLPLSAMAGAFGALVLVLALARSAGRLRRETLVLAGIVTATFLAACIAVLKSLDEDSLASIVFWIMGSMSGRGWEHAAFAAPYMLLGGAAVFLHARELDILSMGDSQARTLGLDADRVRLRILLAASLLTGAAVSVSGVVGFVGLVVPHLVRLCLGSEHRPLLWSSAWLGGLLLIWSDVAARTVLPQGQELPVGVVTALLGGPFFCLLLRRRAGSRP